VQQTVEKIVEGKTTTNTVVVKEEDLVVDAIAKNQSAMFTITKDGFDETGKSIEISAGKGFVVSNSDIIVADAIMVPNKENYFVKNSSGKFKAEFISSDPKGFSFLKIGTSVNEKDKLAYTLPLFGDLNKMKVGQKVLVMGSVISSFIYDGDPNLAIIATKSNAGGLVSDLDGNVLGIALDNSITSFVSIGDITSTLPKP
jgi:S1-C subfamily serine protease